MTCIFNSLKESALEISCDFVSTVTVRIGKNEPDKAFYRYY